MIEIKGRYFIALGVIMYILYFIFSNYYEVIIKNYPCIITIWLVISLIVTFLLATTDWEPDNSVKSIIIYIGCLPLTLIFIVFGFIGEILYPIITKCIDYIINLIMQLFKYIDQKLTIKLKLK